MIRALHELGIEAVAVYSTADADALHVRLADEAVRIGPPPAAESYLNIPSIIAAAVTTGCEAVHPGYGFLSENAAFVERVRRQRPRLRRPAGDGDASDGRQDRGAQSRCAPPACRRVPGTEGATTLARGARGRGRARLPGAAQGGGGRRRARACASSPTPASSTTRSSGAPAEAHAAFGDGTLYLEKVDRAGAPRRDPGALRQARQRAHARRARVLDPAAPPEADRGVAVAGARRRAARGDGGGRRARLPARSATATPARSSSCSARTGRSPSSR